MAIHLPIGPLKTRSGWSRYRDANPIPTSQLAHDITTAPSGPVQLNPFRHSIKPNESASHKRSICECSEHFIDTVAFCHYLFE